MNPSARPQTFHRTVPDELKPRHGWSCRRIEIETIVDCQNDGASGAGRIVSGGSDLPERTKPIKTRMAEREASNIGTLWGERDRYEEEILWV